MKYDYRLYSALPSMYSGKVRGYMNYKQLNYVDKIANAYDIAVKIKSKTGERVLPVVMTRQGEWLQDTTIIIDALEARHPEYSINVTSPIQYAASLLLECWGDEYWLPVAMHYRWSFEENHEFLMSEFSRSTVPFAAGTLGRYVAKRVTRRLANAGPFIGFIPEQYAMLETWTERMLDYLELHFDRYDYLLGGRPTVADFSLLASFFGHLNRDPAPKRILMSSRPRLAAWVERTHSGAIAQGELPADDALPETLMPVLNSVFTEFLPMAEAFRNVLQDHIKSNNLKSGDKVPRALDPASFPMGGYTFTRSVMPYTLWMAQRAQDKIADLSPDDRRSVDLWFEKAIGQKFSEFDLGPRLLRDGLSTVLA